MKISIKDNFEDSEDEVKFWLEKSGTDTIYLMSQKNKEGIRWELAIEAGKEAEKLNWYQCITGNLKKKDIREI